MTGPRTFGADTRVTLAGGKLRIEIGDLVYEVPAGEVALSLGQGSRVLIAGQEVEVVTPVHVAANDSGVVDVSFRGSLVWHPGQLRTVG